jgi:phosphotransferase system  glucose/maltose/N-acetylglucosamine-specific IIC component
MAREMKDVQLIPSAYLKEHVFRGEFSQFSQLFQLILENPILVILLLMLVVLGLILIILWPPICIAICVRVTHMRQCMLELSHIVIGAA